MYTVIIILNDELCVSLTCLSVVPRSILPQNSLNFLWTSCGESTTHQSQNPLPPHRTHTSVRGINVCKGHTPTVMPEKTTILERMERIFLASSHTRHA